MYLLHLLLSTPPKENKVSHVALYRELRYFLHPKSQLTVPHGVPDILPAFLSSFLLHGPLL